MIPVRAHTKLAIEYGTYELVPRLEWRSGNGQEWSPLDVTSWGVSQSRTRQVRWNLSATVDRATCPTGPTGLHPYGCQVRFFLGVSSVRTGIEWLSQGVYRATGVNDSRSSVSISGESEESEVQKSKFILPRNLPDSRWMSKREQLEKLVSEAVPGASFQWDPRLDEASYQPMAQAAYDRERWDAVYGQLGSASIINSLGAELYCDRNGLFTIVPVPTLQSTEEPEITIGYANYQLKRQSDWSQDGVFNVVKVTGQRADTNDPVGPAIVWDQNPGSFTYAGPDPINRPDLAGPYGVKTFFYNSSLVPDMTTAWQTARGLLSNTTGVNNTIQVDTRVDPRMEAGDVAWVEREDGRPTLCLLDTVSLQSGGQCSVTTRSTNGISSGDAGVTG